MTESELVSAVHVGAGVWRWTSRFPGMCSVCAEAIRPPPSGHMRLGDRVRVVHGLYVHVGCEGTT